MCRLDTGGTFITTGAVRRARRAAGWRTMACVFISALQIQALRGQVPSDSPPDLAWKRIAGTTYNAGLAGPATGPVTAAWYAPGASSLLAQTASGRIFETSDFAHWRLNTTVAPPRANAAAPVVSIPEAGAQVQPAAAR